MSQEIISLDSQMLSSFQSCAQKFNYQFVQNLRTDEKAEALEKGDLMHKLLEVAYPMRMNKDYTTRDNFIELQQAGFKIPENPNHQVIRNFADLVADYYAIKMSLPEENVREIIHHFNEYWDYYEHDKWNPLAVEQVGSKILYEDDDVKIVYNFKIDMVAELGNIIAPWDHKTSKRRQEPNSMSNQFIGYCYGLSLNNIVINTIGFQKTLKPKERFNRFILTIDDDRIAEWRVNTIKEVLDMRAAMKENDYRKRFTSCNNFSSGCAYLPICESSPGGRLYKIERDYKVEDVWDPAKKLED
jgi:hypothetical protein